MKLASYIKSRPETVKEMAVQLGVSPQTLHRWMAGTRTPRPAKMAAILKLSDGQVTPNDFLPTDEGRA